MHHSAQEIEDVAPCFMGTAERKAARDHQFVALTKHHLGLGCATSAGPSLFLSIRFVCVTDPALLQLPAVSLVLTEGVEQTNTIL